MPLKTTLTISGHSNIYKGIQEATIHTGVIELIFFRKGKILTKASLANDSMSLHKSLRKTQEKISLLCNRHNINEKNLEYDNKKPSKIQDIIYRLLLLKKLLFKAFVPVQWIIVYKRNDEKRWRKLIPSSKVFQADPFIVYKDNKYFIFYEELDFKDYHGYLMVAELDIKNNKLIKAKKILKLDYHLSYPCIFMDYDTYYMIPETAQGGSIDLYECTSFPYYWKKKQTLLDNISAVDTTPLKIKNTWYLFTSEKIKGAGGNEELTIYKSSSLLNKPFKKLYKYPVVTDVTNARMGGHFIKHNGEIFRVSQNCGKRYGHKVNINKVLQIEGGFKEELVKTHEASFGALGFHTYNHDHEITVGDMEIPRFDYYSLKRLMLSRIQKTIGCV